MGKRKLHNTTFYQCDWTGYPMKTANCHMPYWMDGDKDTGKLMKKGCYANWESVIAHAQEMCTTEEKEKWFRDVVEYVHEMTQTTYLVPAPHFTELSHVRGALSMTEFHSACTAHRGPVQAVKITQTGEIVEVLLEPNEKGMFDFGSFLHKSFWKDQLQPSVFHSTRRLRAQNNRELKVFYYDCRDLPLNTVATNIFKMSLHGDVLLIQQTKEQSFLPRERYVCYTKASFDEQFMKKRRKTTEISGLGREEYGIMHREMQADLNKVEQNLTALAKKPCQFGKVVKPIKTNIGRS